MATKVTIETVNQKLVILRDNGNTMEDGSGYDVKSDGAAFESSSLEAQFYQESSHVGNNLLYRFRSVSQPNKYLAASGSKIILKTIPTNTSSSYDFFSQQLIDGYSRYLYRNSAVNSVTFMSTDSNNDVILAGIPSNANKFLVQPVGSSSNVSSNTPTLLNSSAPGYPADEFEEFFKEANEGAAMISLEIEDESFSGKFIFSERISMSEE